ncbi:hypothetical protein [Craterilacuibacter sinensis]|uniref:Phage protein n=1 Tax=Craterilacuibacter sinensis TaxID=2686017 RepID=A0A845BKD1_9NEIS|nr:hypothetical protein [Craterilacuibacter sinensis]MXR36722.1 hypothetical protein [Craterilacuibacter sinensis]
MHTALDPLKARRESMRWAILLTLNNARPVGAHEALILSTLQGVYPDATALELRRELDYLADRTLIDIKRDPAGPWAADLTRLGVDIVEYTVDCQPGIARPAKYF